MVVGMRRSGLSLLRAMLDSHRDVAFAVESPLSTALTDRPTAGQFDLRGFVGSLYTDPAASRWGLPRTVVERSLDADPPADAASAARHVLSLWASRRGKSRYGIVAPDSMRDISGTAAVLPATRIIHVIRDGRDLAASVLELGRSEGIERVALDWRREVRRARHAGRRLPTGRYYELRYEDLVNDPVVTLRLLCRALELPFDRAMLDYRAAAAEAVRAAGRPTNRFVTRPLMPGLRDWRRDMPAVAIDRFEALAGDLLAELGYELRNQRRSMRSFMATRSQWLRWHREQLRGGSSSGDAL